MVTILTEATRTERYRGIKRSVHKKLTKKEKIMKDKTGMSFYNLEI